MYACTYVTTIFFYLFEARRYSDFVHACVQSLLATVGYYYAESSVASPRRTGAGPGQQLHVENNATRSLQLQPHPGGSLNRYHHHGRFSHAGQGGIIPHPPPYTYPHPGLPTTGPCNEQSNTVTPFHASARHNTELNTNPDPQHHHDVPLPNETMRA
jgi:hypothetical protein